MMVTKEQLVELLRQQGDEGTARQVETETDFPAQVDTERDADLLEKYGIDVSALAGGGAGLEDLAEEPSTTETGVREGSGPTERPPEAGPPGPHSTSIP